MNINLTKEMSHELRSLLKLDSLPAIDDVLLREQLTERFLMTANEVKQAAPHLLAIAGGPGSGKSFFYENLKAKRQLPKDSIISDPDLVMQSIPQYRQDVLSSPAQAFERWELPSRQLANEILLEALVAKYNIVYMRSLALPDSLELVHRAKVLGYTVDIHLLLCDTTLAMTRVQEREKITNRHVPKETLLHRHDAIARLLPDIKDAADNFYLYENNQNGVAPVLIESSVLVD